MGDVETAPLVSVVVTSYNQPGYLAIAVDSAVRQTHRGVEVVVVDDGSSDDSPQVAREHGATTVIEQQNAGAAAARQRGLAAASGDYVVFLDGDDVLHPSAIEDQLRHLRSRPDAHFVSGRNRLVDGHGEPLPTPKVPARGPDLYEAMLRQPWICPPSALLASTGAVRAVGGWDQGLRNAEDLDLYLRLAARYPGVDHMDVVTDYRLHAGMKSKGYDRGLRANLAVLARHAPPGSDARLRRARAAGERHYRRTYGTKEVLDRLQRSVRARELDGGALVAVLRLVATDPIGLLRVVSAALDRRIRGRLRRFRGAHDRSPAR